MGMKYPGLWSPRKIGKNDKRLRGNGSLHICEAYSISRQHQWLNKA